MFSVLDARSYNDCDTRKRCGLINSAKLDCRPWCHHYHMSYSESVHGPAFSLLKRSIKLTVQYDWTWQAEWSYVFRPNFVRKHCCFTALRFFHGKFEIGCPFCRRTTLCCLKSAKAATSLRSAVICIVSLWKRAMSDPSLLRRWLEVDQVQDLLNSTLWRSVFSQGVWSRHVDYTLRVVLKYYSLTYHQMCHCNIHVLISYLIWYSIVRHRWHWRQEVDAWSFWNKTSWMPSFPAHPLGSNLVPRVILCIFNVHQHHVSRQPTRWVRTGQCPWCV